MNIVMLVGNLGAAPEGFIAEGNNTTRCKMSIATNKKWTDRNGQKKERTDWHKITCFGPLADACMQFLDKGSHVAVQGELRTSKWEDDDGNKRTSVEIVARSVEFLDKRPPVENQSDIDEDIPF